MDESWGSPWRYRNDSEAKMENMLRTVDVEHDCAMLAYQY